VIGADSLGFLSLDGMMRAIVGGEPPAETGHRDTGDGAGRAGWCNACFTGDYPIDIGRAQAKHGFEGVLA
jgi:amidophosphoribosyltransferase